MVSSLERALRPTGCQFKSPDYLFDTETGTTREVDCSITFLESGREQRISIECRRRGARQDVTWIEQLATKMRALRLAGTIAVSSVGFSKTAYLKAEHHGITLNTYREMKLALAERPFRFQQTRRTWSLLRFHYELPDECPVLADAVQRSIEERLTGASPDEPLFRVIESKEALSIRTVIENALDSSAKPQTEPIKERTFKVRFKKPTTLVDLSDSFPLTSAELKVNVQLENIQTPEPVFGTYRGPMGILLQVARVRFSHAASHYDINVYFNTDETTQPAGGGRVDA